jgi:hypothetical protein
MTAETRTVIPQVDPMTLRVMDMRCESVRLAYIDQSRRTVAGCRAEYRPPEYNQEPRDSL